MARPRKNCPDCDGPPELIQILGAQAVSPEAGENPFWLGGQRAALNGLRKEYAEKIAALEKQVTTAGNDVERGRLRIAIFKARKEWAEKEERLRWGLFLA